MGKRSKRIPELTLKQVIRFCAKIRIGPKCWEWQGRPTGNIKYGGYGCIRLNQVPFLSHRVAYKLHTGIDPGDLLVCHKCDNPICCRPSHLFLGTQAQNLEDMYKKRRQNIARGIRHSQAKLTESDIRKIRASSRTGRQLAKQFKMSPAAISNILNRNTWKHVR